MRTITTNITTCEVFAIQQDRVVVSMCRESWLSAAQHLQAWAARQAHRLGGAIKSAALAVAAGADRYAERLFGMLPGPQMCPAPVRRRSPAQTT